MSTEHARKPARRVLGTLAAPALVLAALVGPAAPAHAEPGPGAKIAGALRESPVYVDPAYAGAVPPSRQRSLERQIERTGLPLHVVLVPLVEGDAFGGEADQLAEVVHARMGLDADEEWILITTSELGSTWLKGHEWPDEKHQARDAASAVGFQDEMDGKGLPAHVSRAIEIVDAGDGRKQYEEATEDLGKDSPVPGQEGSGPSTAVTVAVVSAAVLAMAAGAFVLVRRRRGPAPISSPSLVLAAARSSDERALRRRAQEQLVAFGEELSGFEAGGSPGADSAGELQHALDAYAAAGTVLDSARGLTDLAGVLALVTEGKESLRAVREPAARPPRKALTFRKQSKQRRQQPRPTLPVCFFHPLHGRADRRIRWRPLGRREVLRIAACRDCANAVHEHRAPEVLKDRHGGREVPYFEVPADESLWAATGYGSLGEETLTERVIRGDFSRLAGG